MNGSPTAAQKRFHEWCRDLGCILTHGPASIHHIGGARMKLKGCKNPGDWYCIPLSYYWHQDLTNPSAVHTNRKQFEIYWGKTEKLLWFNLIMMYEAEHGEKPMSELEFQIIADRA